MTIRKMISFLLKQLYNRVLLRIWNKLLRIEFKINITVRSNLVRYGLKTWNYISMDHKTLNVCNYRFSYYRQIKLFHFFRIDAINHYLPIISRDSYDILNTVKTKNIHTKKDRLGIMELKWITDHLKRASNQATNYSYFKKLISRMQHISYNYLAARFNPLCRQLSASLPLDSSLTTFFKHTVGQQKTEIFNRLKLRNSIFFSPLFTANTKLTEKNAFHNSENPYFGVLNRLHKVQQVYKRVGNGKTISIIRELLTSNIKFISIALKVINEIICGNNAKNKFYFPFYLRRSIRYSKLIISKYTVKLAISQTSRIKKKKIISLMGYTNDLFVLALHKKLLIYDGYFVRSFSIYLLYDLASERYAPINTYRTLLACGISIFSKYYLSLEKNVHNTARLGYELFLLDNRLETTNKFYHIFKRNEYAYSGNKPNYTSFIRYFFRTEIPFIEYTSGLVKQLSTSNYYYPTASNSIEGLLEYNTCDHYKSRKTYAISMSAEKVWGKQRSDNEVLYEIRAGLLAKPMSNTLNRKTIHAQTLFKNTLLKNAEQANASNKLLPIPDIAIHMDKQRNHMQFLRDTLGRRRSTAFLKTSMYANLNTYLAMLGPLKPTPTAKYMKNSSLLDQISIEYLIYRIIVPIVIYIVILNNETNKPKDNKTLYGTIKHDMINPIISTNCSEKIIGLIIKTVLKMCRVTEYMLAAVTERGTKQIQTIFNNMLLLLTQLQRLNECYKDKHMKPKNVVMARKSYQKIVKTKFLKKKNNLVKEMIKYFKYDISLNTACIYIDRTVYTELTNAAANLFYLKSKRRNNNYNYITRVNTLWFKKLLSCVRGKYSINRWLSLHDLLFDLISNYKTIHKDSSTHELVPFYELPTTPTHLPTYGRTELSQYLSDGHYPYPRNLLTTTINNNFIIEMWQFIINDYLPYYETDTNIFWNTERRGKYLNFDSALLEPFEDTVINELKYNLLVEEYFPVAIKQKMLDIASRNIVLWDIPVSAHKTVNHTNYVYEPSYFSCEPYYLDYIDYVLFKHYSLNMSEDSNFKSMYIKMNYETEDEEPNIEVDKLDKLSWDINTYDIELPVATISDNNINPFYYSDFTDMCTLRPTETAPALLTHMFGTLKAYDIDPTPFQTTALRLLLNTKVDATPATSNSHKLENIISKLRVFQSNNMNGKKVLAVSAAKTNATCTLPMFEPIERTLNKEDDNYGYYKKIQDSLYYFTEPRIKTLNRPSLTDLHIVPNYVRSFIDKELYLYRKVIGQEINAKIRNILPSNSLYMVEQSRLTRSIIKLKNEHNIFEQITIESNHLKSNMFFLELYKKNLCYYNQIVIPYHNYIYNHVKKTMLEAFASGYEWDTKVSSFVIPTEKAIEKKKKKEITTYLELEESLKINLNQLVRACLFQYNATHNELNNNALLPPTMLGNRKLPVKLPIERKPTIVSLIDYSNKQLAACLYIGDLLEESKSLLQPGNKVLEKNDITFSIYITLSTFKKNIHRKIFSHYKKMCYINKKINGLGLSLDRKMKYLYSATIDLCKLFEENIAVKVPLSIMLLYIAGLPFVKKFYSSINNNLAKLIVDPSQYSMGISKQIKPYLSKDTITSNKSSEVKIHENIVGQFELQARTSAQNKEYNKLYNSYIERRFIWYISKILLNKTSQLPLKAYRNHSSLYHALLHKNKITNNKLSISNLENVLQHQLSMDRFIIGSFKLAFDKYNALYNTGNTYPCYLSVEPVYPIIKGKEEITDVVLYYKKVPFNLQSKHNIFPIIYLSHSNKYNKQNDYYYLTYPIRKSGIPSEGMITKTEYFLRYKILNTEIDSNTKLRKQHVKSTCKPILKLLEDQIKLYQERKKKVYNVKKCMLPEQSIRTNKTHFYTSFIKHNFGILHYSIDLNKDQATKARILSLTKTTNEDVCYIQYANNTYYDESDVFCMNEEIIVTSDETHTEPPELEDVENGYFYVHQHSETEEAMLLRFVHSLHIRKTHITHGQHKVKLQLNTNYFLIYSILMEPIMAIVGFGLVNTLDTESSSLLKYNLQKTPLLGDSAYESIKKFPLAYRWNEDATIPLGTPWKLRITGLKIHPGKRLYVWGVHLGPHTGQDATLEPIRIETEPLRFLGMEVTINPFFRVFTHSGWKIWREQLDALLLFQQNTLWNINYSTDIQLFLNIFKNKNARTLPTEKIKKIRDTLKTYSLHEEHLPTHLQKYHKTSNLKMFNEWLEMYSYGLLEYQRIMPDSYHKLFTQPAVRAHLYYYFINAKEYGIITRRPLNQISNRIYSLQRSRESFEEFFVYPNKRIRPRQKLLRGQYKKNLWLYNYSRSTSKFKYPRTGYEAYPYSYAQNMFYFHNRLATKESIYHLYYRQNYLPREQMESLATYKRDAYNYYRKIRRSFYNTYKGYINKPSVPRIKRSFWENMDRDEVNVLYKNKFFLLPDEKLRNDSLPYAAKYCLQDKLQKWFVPNTIKYTDINLLYKPYRSKNYSTSAVRFVLHPSISKRYSISNNYNSNYNRSFFLFQKLKTTKMLLINSLLTTNYKIHVNRRMFKRLDVRLGLSNVARAFKGHSKFVLNSNAFFHENSFGPLWYIYPKRIIDPTNATNTSSLGITKRMLFDGLAGIRQIKQIKKKRKTVVKAISSDFRKYSEYAGKRANTLPVKVTDYPRLKSRYVTFSRIHGTLNIGNHKDARQSSFIKLLLKPPVRGGSIYGFYRNSRRRYKGLVMNTLHKAQIPYNYRSIKEFTSYIPIRYSLQTKDLLNTNYLKSYTWYNKVYYLNKTYHKPSKKSKVAIVRLRLPKEVVKWRKYRRRRTKQRREMGWITSNEFLNSTHSLNKAFTVNDYDMLQDVAILQDVNESYTVLSSLHGYIRDKDVYGIITHPSALIDYIRTFIPDDRYKQYAFLMNDYASNFPWVNSSIAGVPLANNIDIAKQNKINFFDTLIDIRKSKKQARIKWDWNILANGKMRRRRYRKKISAIPRYRRRLDVSYTMVRGYIPNKVYKQVSSYINRANIYFNRYKFINIYESFRMKPFSYMRQGIPVHRDTTTMAYTLSPLLNKAKVTLNRFLYPLEGQWSSERKTSSLFVVDLRWKSSYTHKRFKRRRIAMIKRTVREMWPFRLGYFHRKKVAFNLKLGINRKKKHIYQIFDTFKLNWYNKIMLSTYYRPTKSFFPSNAMYELGKTMRLREYGKYDYSNDKYNLLYNGSNIMKSETLYRRDNFPNELLKKLVLQKRSSIREQFVEYTTKKRKRKVKRKKIPVKIIEYQPYYKPRIKGRSKAEKIYLDKYHDMMTLLGVDPHVLGRSSLSLLVNKDRVHKHTDKRIRHNFSYRYSAVRPRKRLFKRGKLPAWKPYAVMHKDNKVYRAFNLGRSIMRQLSTGMPSDHVLTRIPIRQIYFAPATFSLKETRNSDPTEIFDGLHRLTRKQFKRPNIRYPTHPNQELEFYKPKLSFVPMDGQSEWDYKRFKKHHFQKIPRYLRIPLGREINIPKYIRKRANLHNHLYEFNLNLRYFFRRKMFRRRRKLFRLTGDCYGLEKETYKSGYSEHLPNRRYKLARTVHIFNNTSCHDFVSRRIRRRKGRPYRDKIRGKNIIKPNKHSVKHYRLKKLVHSILRRKENIYSGNVYNTAYIKKYRGNCGKIVRRVYPLRRSKFHRRTRYLTYHGFAVSTKRHGKQLNKVHKGILRHKYKYSYWQYKQNKSLENQSNKLYSSEVITFKGSPDKHIKSRITKKTDAPVVVRGTFMDKEYIYNYKINYKQCSLPLVEYFYYTQYGVDKINTLILNKFYILVKDTATIFEEQTINTHPFIDKGIANQQRHPLLLYTNIISKSNKSKGMFLENMETMNAVETFNQSLSIIYSNVMVDSHTYLYNNSFTRPMVHWFVHIYYNNLYYFDAFYSWCCDFLVSINIF